MKALDLFCGGGGVCEGLQRLGYSVTGIDNDPRCERTYPGTFVLDDASSVTPEQAAEYDLVWASPPCQRFSRASSRVNRWRHPDLLTPTRSVLVESGTRWVIENVPGAPMRPDVRVNGALVGLHRIVRERWFDVSNLPSGWMQPVLTLPERHRWESGEMCVISTTMSNKAHYYPRKRAGKPGMIPKWEAMEVMGITHDMTVVQIGEAVPPAYAEYVAGLVSCGDRRLW